MRPLGPAAALAAGILLAAALPASADLSGVPVKNGNKVLGQISPSCDDDSFAIPLVAGGKLTVKVVVARTELLFPSIEVRDPSGAAVPLGLSLKGAETQRPQVRNLLIDETGIWTVRLTGDAGSTGLYTVSFASKAPPKVVYLASPLAGTGTTAFTAAGYDGTVLGFTLKLKGGPAVGDVEVQDPEGDPVALPTAPMVRRGLIVSGRGYQLAGGFGIYGVVAGGIGPGDSVVDAIVKTKHPRPDRTIRTLDAEPRPTSDSTPMRPPIRVTMRRQIARPRPVPP